MPQQTIKYQHPMQDGRRKIDPNQYPEIKAYYKITKSQRKTAEHYQISRRLVQFILDPSKLERQKKQNKANQHWKKYYDTNKRKEYMRTYRAKKRKLGFIN